MLERWSSLTEGEYSCYGGGQFKGGRMVLENGEWCYRGGLFNGRGLVMLERWTV